ncbi:MAG: tRNA (adenosine(37)-N6)-threonylcarbamoyltransferase complex transferase subunit TsaD [Coriobacteriales bacterium]|jgi:tRNA threonylcarbamoyl adenosine modification protein TsaD/tRNA threonylcarbamoyl adenosine modification protein YeaZ|nr:tRNA (adenosine(37)-N6)-threonylcarbamoyltransferase complex transferase subunit TsaD [Coriobacteriales bacterium]
MNTASTGQPAEPAQTSGFSLIIDSASDQVVCGLARGEGLLADLHIDAARSANQRLIPTIEQLLRQNQVDKTDLKRIICGIGPGSFTGIRIALACARALSSALGLPLYGVSSLDAIAEQLRPEHPDCPDFAVFIDALRGESSVASYHQDGTTLHVTAPAQTLPPEQLPDLPLLTGQAQARGYWQAYQDGLWQDPQAIYTRPSFAEEQEAVPAPPDAPQAVEDFAGGSHPTAALNTPAKQPTRAGAEAPQATKAILAIESSCDETAAAVITLDGELLSNVISSQVAAHARFNGVVPEIASRKHIEYIQPVVEMALEDARVAYSGRPSQVNLAAVAVTYAPGLIGGLVIGVSFAKALAWALDLPLIMVNHLEGHIYANLLEHPKLEPPFVAALISGGNTMLVEASNWGHYRVLGQTIDDAAGECFDKVSKALGLGYPGGPAISKMAQGGNPKAVRFPRAMIGRHDLMFSFSGLKTAVLEYLHAQEATGHPVGPAELPDVCASFEAAVIDVQVRKALKAVEQTGVKTFCAGGGVAANQELRQAYQEAFAKREVAVYLPGKIACTDNAAMIARAALDRYQAGRFSDLSADAEARADLERPY